MVGYGKPYTHKENQIVTRLFNEGKSDEYISNQLKKRSESSVRIHRVRCLGLKRRPTNDPLLRIIENQRKLMGMEE